MKHHIICTSLLALVGAQDSSMSREFPGEISGRKFSAIMDMLVYELDTQYSALESVGFLSKNVSKTRQSFFTNK